MLRQRRLLGVLHDQRIETGSVGQGTAHHPGIGERPLAVGKGNRTRRLEQADLGQLPAFQTLGDGGVGVDLALLHLPRPAGQELDHCRVVDRRVGVGQDRHAGDPAGGRGRHAAVDPLLVLGAGLAELHAHVDQARRQAQALGVDHLGTAGRQRHRHARADLGDPAADDQHAPSPVEPGCGVEQARVDDHDGPAHAAPTRRCWVKRSSTAIRTATPISTWSRMALRSMSSATTPSISTPRFIGPGCMISASGLAARNLS